MPPCEGVALIETEVAEVDIELERGSSPFVDAADVDRKPGLGIPVGAVLEVTAIE